MNTRRSLRSAFTLVELLIVITIIGILSVALIPRLLGAPARARDVQRRADLQSLATAFASYADDSGGGYPLTNLCPDTLATGGQLDAYLTSLPHDPLDLHGWSGTNDCNDADEGGYLYQPTTNGFLLVAQLENVNATGDGVYKSTVAVNSASALTTQAALTSLSGFLCETGGSGNHDCSAGAVYILAR